MVTVSKKILWVSIALVLVFSTVAILGTMDFENVRHVDTNPDKLKTGGYHTSSSSSLSHIEVVVKEPGLNYLELSRSIDIKRFTGITHVYINGELINDDRAKIENDQLVLSNNEDILYAKIYFTKSLTRAELHHVEKCEPSSVLKDEHKRHILNGTHKYDLQHCKWNEIVPNPELEIPKNIERFSKLMHSINTEWEPKVMNKIPTSGYDILPLNDASQYNAAFSGEIAETVCRFLDIPCPTEPKFRGQYDFAEQNGGFNYYIGQDNYRFKITNGDTILVYSTTHNAWVTLEEYKNKPKIEPESKPVYSFTFYADDGKYEEWCFIFNGLWEYNSNDSVSCIFTNQDKYSKAKNGLEALGDPDKPDWIDDFEIDYTENMINLN